MWTEEAASCAPEDTQPPSARQGCDHSEQPATFLDACSFLSPLTPQWENHNKSLQLEAQTYQRIHEKIQERVMNNLGTWIDWQYLQNAAKLLAKVCPPQSSHPLFSVRPRPLEGGRHCQGQGSPPVKSRMCQLMGPHLPGLCPLRTLPSLDIQGTQYSSASACGDRTTGKRRALLFFCPIHASLRGK